MSQLLQCGPVLITGQGQDLTRVQVLYCLPERICSDLLAQL